MVLKEIEELADFFDHFDDETKRARDNKVTILESEISKVLLEKIHQVILDEFSIVFFKNRIRMLFLTGTGAFHEKRLGYIMLKHKHVGTNESAEDKLIRLGKNKPYENSMYAISLKFLDTKIKRLEKILSLTNYGKQTVSTGIIEENKNLKTKLKEYKYRLGLKEQKSK